MAGEPQVKRAGAGTGTGAGTRTGNRAGSRKKQGEIPKIVMQLLAAVVVIVLLLAYFVWPTPWTYYDNGSTHYRTNRWSGGTQVLLDDKWVDS